VVLNGGELMEKVGYDQLGLSSHELKFIKTNGYQSRTENIKARLFFMYTFQSSGLASVGVYMKFNMVLT
jgi:hypothetical protein